MSTFINPYIHFSGRCREAMSFYQHCLGGDLSLQVVSESPMAGQWPASVQNQILHASLTSGILVLLGSDMSDGAEHHANGIITLSLTCSGPDEMITVFDKLADGGTVRQKPHEFFAGMIGALTDRFGIQWMFYADNKAPDKQ
jgi:PhnB protein